jgi:hypothetical protein
MKLTDFMKQSHLSLFIKPEDMDVVLSHNHPMELVGTLITLTNERIVLTEEQKLMVIKLENPNLMIDNIIHANELEIYFNLPRINKDIFIHPNPDKLIVSLLALKDNKMLVLTSDDFDKIINSKYIECITDIMIQLKNINFLLLTRENIEAIINHKNIDKIYKEFKRIIKLNGDIKQSDIDNILNMKKTPYNPLRFHQAYNHREVIGLKPITLWTKHEEKCHVEINRVLQPGFMYREPSKVLSDAKLVKAEWITDFCCPSFTAAIILNIAKELLVNYKIKENDLNIATHKIYHHMITHDHIMLFNPEQKIEKKFKTMMKYNGELNEEYLNKLTKEIRLYVE